MAAQVERRRAERKRAVTINALTQPELHLLLARELADAKASAKAAKAAGDAEHKRVAGMVIKQLKLELATVGVSEAELERLLAEHEGRQLPGACVFS